MSHEDDILQPLTNNDELHKLRTLYKDVRPSASHIYNYLSNVIRRNSVEPNSTHYTILVPYGNVEKGTFFGIEQGSVIMYTLEEDMTTLQEALTKTERFNWSLGWVLYAVAEHHFPSVIKILEHRGLKYSRIGQCGVWWIAKENAINFSVSCPEDVHIAPLESVHVDTINHVWPARFPGSESYLLDIITFGGGYGVFLKSNGLLVSWALMNPIGIGNIQTLDGYTRKGYGTLIGKYISKKIAERGCDPLGTVRTDNVASETMFSKLGFEMVANVMYVFNQQMYEEQKTVK